MSFNTKSIFISVLVILGITFFGFREYRNLHPKYIPLPPRAEVTLTIIPGWNLRQVAEYLVLKGLATSTSVVYTETAMPAVTYLHGQQQPARLDTVAPVGFHLPYVSYEGYLAPETMRVFVGSSVQDVLLKFVALRHKQLTTDIDTRQGLYDLNAYVGSKTTKFGRFLTNQAASSYIFSHELLTMASIVEKETKYDEDRAKVADILWRRWAAQMALQVDSSVHYAVDRTGDVFTTEKERKIDSPWNTYKYPGLPPGPICNPSIESIKASLYPEKNEYWYFLSGKDGKMYYGKTLEEHNKNKKYL